LGVDLRPDPESVSTGPSPDVPARAPRDSFLVFGAPLIGEEEIADVVDSLRSGWVGSGPKVKRFEEQLAQ
jgi:hypothetical protein